jgi:hypothetical protein
MGFLIYGLLDIPEPRWQKKDLGPIGLKNSQKSEADWGIGRNDANWRQWPDDALR